MKVDIGDLRFRRLVGHLHALGPRALGEFLVALRVQEKVANNLERYGELTPQMLEVANADRWPPIPLHSVDGQ